MMGDGVLWATPDESPEIIGFELSLPFIFLWLVGFLSSMPLRSDGHITAGPILGTEIIWWIIVPILLGVAFVAGSLILFAIAYGVFYVIGGVALAIHGLDFSRPIHRASSPSDDRMVAACPECDTSAINHRETMEPEYRCTNGHEFDEPTVRKPKEPHG